MPGPVSISSRSTPSPEGRVRTTSSPPASMAWTALMSRLRTADRKVSRSSRTAGSSGSRYRTTSTPDSSARIAKKSSNWASSALRLPGSSVNDSWRAKSRKSSSNFCSRSHSCRTRSILALARRSRCFVGESGSVLSKSSARSSMLSRIVDSGLRISWARPPTRAANSAYVSARE